MLLLVRHLAKGAGVTVRQKHRVVAKTFGAAGRPHQRAVNNGLEFLDVTVRPGDAERTYEMRPAFVLRPCPAFAQLVLHHLHGAAKVPVGAGPARGMNTGRAAERVDGQPGIIGERRQARAQRSGACLEARVFKKSFSGLLGLREVKLGC